MHIIFDLDGTLLDTEFEMAKIISDLAKEKGCVISADDVFTRYTGLGAKAKFIKIAEECGVKLSDAEITELARRHEDEKHKLELPGTPSPAFVPGAPELLDSLEKEGNTLSLASSNPSEITKGALDKVGLRRHFNDRVYGPDNSGGKPKPDPGVYLAAMAAAPQLTTRIVVEDSTAGIAAGHAAGGYVIARLDPRFGTGAIARAKIAEFKKAGADVVIRDYKDLEKNLPRQNKHNVMKLAS
jgi:HAD superfamily hydrolase (TIGR01509 family)